MLIAFRDSVDRLGRRSPLPLWSLTALGVVFVLSVGAGLSADAGRWHPGSFVTNCLSTLATSSVGLPLLIVGIERVRRRQASGSWIVLHVALATRICEAAVDLARGCREGLRCDGLGEPLSEWAVASTADRLPSPHALMDGVLATTSAVADLYGREWPDHELSKAGGSLVECGAIECGRLLSDVVEALAGSPLFEVVAPSVHDLMFNVNTIGKGAVGAAGMASDPDELPTRVAGAVMQARTTALALVPEHRRRLLKAARSVTAP